MPLDSHRQPAFSRRQALHRLGVFTLGGLAVGALAACSTAAPQAASQPTAAPAAGGATSASGGFDWQRFKGQTITALHVQNSRTDILVKNQPEFEALTGIKVNSDVLPEQQQRQKLLIEFSSGNPSFDVTTLSWHV